MLLIPLELHRRPASFACSPLCLLEVCPNDKNPLFPQVHGPTINPYPVFFPIWHQHDQSSPNHPALLLRSTAEIEYP